MKQLFFLILIFFSFQLLSLNIPALQSHINDHANILTRQEKANLDNYLSQYERNTGIQVAVLIIRSLQNEILENYSLRVAEKWQLGAKDKDNGVLLLISMQEKKLRIEVGYGLEGVLTDAQSGFIIRNEIVPYFKNGNYYSGISAGLQTITGVLSKEIEITDEQIAQSRKQQETGRAQLPFGLMVFLFMIFFGGLGRRRGGLLPFLFLGSMLGGSSRSGGRGFGGFSGGGGGFGGGGASGGW
jgi:uncharacterized protein